MAVSEYDTTMLAKMLSVDEVRIRRTADVSRVSMRIAHLWMSADFAAKQLEIGKDPVHEIGHLCFDIARQLRQRVDRERAQVIVEIPAQEFTQLNPMPPMSPYAMKKFTTPAKKPEVKQLANRFEAIGEEIKKMMETDK